MIALQITACVSALCAGKCLSEVVWHSRERKRRCRTSRALAVGQPQNLRSIEAAIFDLWKRWSLGVGGRSSPVVHALTSIFSRSSQRWMERQGAYLGAVELTAEGLASTRMLCGLAGSAAALVLTFGFGASPSGCALAMMLGVGAASRLPLRMAKKRIQQRRDNLEQELPQMLAMVSLGLRGGLSFERSFALYAEGFDTDFARACLNAQRRWEMSLVTREEALRDLARSYQSDLLEQSVESMIRSLRLGTALVDNLEALTHEARNRYRMACEEAIARAPVKMLVPTGTLILPAMLILVMGPILLEMMGGF